ncbi:MAG: DUF11 domain-containing protein [Anaerolineae bacterium]|nr:DUF11 domain-containing protein [Anaerolineae bacterium]
MNLSKLIRNERAQGLVEFALTLIFFLMLIFMIIELGRIMHAIVTLQAGVRAGARYAVTGDWMTEYGNDPTYGWTGGSGDPLEQIPPCWPLFPGDSEVAGTPREPYPGMEYYQPHRNARTCSVEHQALGQMTSLQLNPQADILLSEPNSYELVVSGMGLLPDGSDEYEVGGTTHTYSEKGYGTASSNYTLIRGYAGLPQQKVVVQVRYRLPIITPILSSIAPSLELQTRAVMTNEAFGSTGLNREAITPPELGDISPLENPIPPDLVIDSFVYDPSELGLIDEIGDTLTVDVVINNIGNLDAVADPAGDIKVCFYTTTSELPANADEIAETEIGCGTFTDLAAGGTVTVPGIIVTINKGGTIYLYGWVDSNKVVDEDGEDGTSYEFPQNEENNILLLAEIVAGDVADIGVLPGTPGLSNSTPADGNTFEYNLVVTNNGSSDTSNVVVRIDLPAGFEFTAGSGGCYSWSAPGSSPVTCTINSLDVGNSVYPSLTILVTSGTTSDIYTLTASITSSALPDNNTSNNSTSAEVAVNGTELSLTKIFSPTEPSNGENITYTVTVNNVEGNAAADVQITDVLNVSHYSSISYTSQVCTGLDGTGACNAGGTYDNTTWDLTGFSIPVGGSAVLEVTAEIATFDELTNTAAISSAPPDPESDNNSESVSVMPYNIDLEFEPIDGPTEGAPGDEVTYSITLKNVSSYPATDIQVQVYIPAELTVTASDASPHSFSEVSNIWIVNQLNAGSSAILDLTVQIDPTLPDPAPELVLAAEVIVADETDVDSIPGDGIGDDYVEHAFTPSSNLDLELVSGTVDPVTVSAGQTVTYTYEIINNGPGTAFDVELINALPDDIIDELRITELDVQNSTITVTLRESDGALLLGDLPDGENPTLVIKGIVRGRSSTETFTNTATLTLDTPGDSTPGNNEVDLEVTLTPLTYAYNVAYQDGDLDCNQDKVWGANSSLGLDYTWVEIPSSVIHGTYSSSGYTQGTIRYQNGTTLNQAGQELYNCRIWGADFYLEWDDLEEGTWTVVLGWVEDWQDYRLFDLTATTQYMNTLLLNNYSIYNSVGYYDRLELKTFEGIQVGDDETLRLTFHGENSTHGILESVLLIYEDAPAQVADLSVTKTLVDPVSGNPIAGAVYPGDDIRFEITVDNDGPSNAGGVSILDELDDGLIFNSASAGKGSYNSSTGIWSIGTINDGASYTLTIDATVDPGLSTPVDLYNTAAVATTLQINPTSPGPNSATILIDVNQTNANIQVDQVGTTSALPGGTATFTVTATNAGPSNATLVEITDLLGDGLNFVSATPTQGTVSVTEVVGGDDTIVWSIPTLAMGAVETLIIEATVDPGISTFPTDIDNIATRTASTPDDLIPADNSDTVTVTVQDPRIDLSLEKSVDPTDLGTGTPFTYTLTLTNEAAYAVATGITVTDTLPAGITVTGSDTHGYGSYAAGVWSGFNLNPGASATLEIFAEVTAPLGTVITNTAEVTAVGQTDIDSTPNNGNTGEDDYASVAFTVIAPNTDLALTLSADDTTPTVYDDVVFTIDIDEQGAGAATGVEATLVLPTGLTYVSNTGTCTHTAGTVTCDIGAIAMNGSASVTVTASVDEDKDGSNFTVAAEVTAIDQTDDDSTPGDGAGDDYDTVSVTPHANFFFVNVGNYVSYRCGNRTFGPTEIGSNWLYMGQAATWQLLGRRDVTFYGMTTGPSGLDWIGSVSYNDANSLTDQDRTIRYPNTSSVPGGYESDYLYRCREDRSSLTVNFNNLEPGTYRLYYLSWNYNNSTDWDVDYRIGSGLWQSWLNNYDSYSSAGDNVMDVEVSSSIVLSTTNSITVQIGNGGMTSGIGIEKLP